MNIKDTFSKNKPTFMPYFTLGYPDYETSLDIIQACAEAGADLMELGVPFSDPLADGPVIQHSTQVALEKGMTVARCLAGVRELRARGVTIPFMLMGYINPILAYGIERFVQDAKEAGANGLIVPDLTPEEAGELENLCKEHGLALVFLVAPNSTEERIQLVCKRTTGFVYLVSVMGVTGSRSDLPVGLREFTERVRKYARVPLAVGFGISTPDQASSVGEVADGVIVGSALVREVGEAIRTKNDPVSAARKFVESINHGLKK
ncbi:MAG TPA: tryptophan synthase subunit alpha [Anaerolineales bacterium]|nr:tryptophan synthase subunit alpha [Anaerolineales bacterium]